jgi:hypothetical protein
MTVLATIVDWDSLGQAALASVGFGLGVLLAAGLAVSSELRAEDERRAGNEGVAIAYRAATVVLVGLVVAAVLFGIWIMGPGSES